MAKLDWLWDALAMASGVPPCLWRSVPESTQAFVQPDQLQFVRLTDGQASSTRCKPANLASTNDPKREPGFFERVNDDLGSTMTRGRNGIKQEMQKEEIEKEEVVCI
jgi:hypothetical protein